MGREASKKTRKVGTANSGGEDAEACTEIKVSPSDAAKLKAAIGNMQSAQARFGVMRSSYLQQEQAAVEEIRKVEDQLHHISAVVRDKLEVPEGWLLDLGAMKFVPNPHLVK